MLPHGRYRIKRFHCKEEAILHLQDGFPPITIRKNSHSAVDLSFIDDYDDYAEIIDLQKPIKYCYKSNKK
jgi:hypothetical protein